VENNTRHFVPGRAELRHARRATHAPSPSQKKVPRRVRVELAQADGRNGKRGISPVLQEGGSQGAHKQERRGGIGVLIHDRDGERIPERTDRFIRLSLRREPLSHGELRNPTLSLPDTPSDGQACPQDMQPVPRAEEVRSKHAGQHMQRRRQRRETERAEPFLRVMEDEFRRLLDAEQSGCSYRFQKPHGGRVPPDQDVLPVVYRITGCRVDEGIRTSAEVRFLLEEEYRNSACSKVHARREAAETPSYDDRRVQRGPEYFSRWLSQ